MSMASTPTDAERQLILLDEVDGMTSGRGDPLVPLTEELADPSNPIIMTANSKYDVPQSVKSAAKMFELSLGKRSRKAKLRDIAQEEGVEIDSEDLDSLAERPDLRSAINDLQTWAEEDIPPSNDERQWTEGAFEIMENILRGDPDLGFGETPEDMVIWLDENVKKEYRGLEATVAYDCIRRADKYAGYAQDTRNYRYWKYAGSLLEQVARVRLTDTHDYYIDLDFPTWFRSSTPSPSDSKPIASVYRKLKDTEGGTFQFGGNYGYFRKVLLPMIKKMPTETRKELALDNGLERDEVEVLGLSKDDFDRWTDDEVPESRQEEEAAIKQESAMDW
jgi:replication factor C large subunit